MDRRSESSSWFKRTDRLVLRLIDCNFCRLVQLDKLRLQTRAKEEEQALARGGKDPFIVVKNPSASKGGVAETSIKVRIPKKMSYLKH